MFLPLFSILFLGPLSPAVVAQTNVLLGPASQPVSINIGSDVSQTISVTPAIGNRKQETGCTKDTPEQLRTIPIVGEDRTNERKFHCINLDLPRPYVALRYPLISSKKWVAPITKEVILDSENALPGGNSWSLTTLAPGLTRLLYFELGTDCNPSDPKSPFERQTPPRPRNLHQNRLCYYRVLLVNTAAHPSSEHHWVEGFRATADGLKIEPALWDGLSADLAFVVNGNSLTPELGGLIYGSKDISTYHIEVYENAPGCRKYTLKYETGTYPESIDIEIPILRLIERVDTGIRVGSPKVYDSYLLRSKMNAAAAQLAAISPWNATAITNAYGTLQGVTKDTSYFAAQLQTTPTPSQVITNATGSSTLSPSVTNSQTAQCPAGYFASQITSTGVTCSALPQQSQQCPAGYYASSASPLVCSVLPIANPGTPLPPATFSSTQNNAAPQSSQVQTTVPSFTPTIPSAPPSTPFTAPTNLSVSSSDMLAEQVQLNAQLQMYQMLLQGSQSDQFLVKNSLAVAPRAQTTIGFQISLAPPRQYKHAVAEVRVVIVPHPHRDQPAVENSDRISVVNLLPSQKTYNVAKITSHQDAFGAGAVIEQVNVGLNTGRSKDRLYLAKDTDTIALEYPILPVPALKPPFPEQALEWFEEVIKEQPLGECPKTWEEDTPALGRASVMFGWQFRPVLGAAYVTAGPREVFAQLALPSELDQDGFAPAVYVQTRWREYNEKRQVVGPVYRDSCVWTRAQDSISILSPLRVHNVTWEDVGNGILKVRADGKFFASGMTVMSAGTNISPSTFDGRSIQFFAPAHDLLQNGKILLLGENGRTTTLSTPIRDSALDRCGIDDASMKAVPFPDGNSRVELKISYKPAYESDRAMDGAIHPLVLIANDVYGLQSKPFQDSVEETCSDLSCTYHFLAPTDSLRSAQTALVRDIAWDSLQKVIPIQIGPAFSSLATLTPLLEDSATPPARNPAQNQAPRPPPVPGNHAPANPSLWYAVSGNGFLDSDSQSYGGLKLYLDDDNPSAGIDLTNVNFRPLSNTTALLLLPHKPKSKSIKIAWDPEGEAYVDSSNPVLWDLDVPSDKEKNAISVDPPFLHVGDSQIVTFTGKFKNATGVYFDASPAPLLAAKAPKFLDLKTLKVPVTTQDVTKLAGHKQLEVKTVDDKGQPDKSIYLEIDVVRR